jgi:flagellar hook protein FlgE
MAKSLLTVKVKKRKTILPRGADAKHLGEEPSWEDLGFLNESELREKEMSALNWYNYFYEPKEGRKFILEFMEVVNMPKAAVTMFNRLPDSQINSTTAAMARMYVMGWEDSDKRKKIESRIMDLCRKGADLYAEDKKQAAVKANVPQKINTNELITDIEQMIDEDSESLSSFYEWLKNRNAKPTDVRGVVDYYAGWFAELVEASDRNADPQLRVAYAYMSKKQLKERVDLFSGIIADCESFLSNSRKSVVRKPRKTKPKTADKVVSKMKFQKEHDELKIVSIDPTKIVGARELWTFNTKYNVLAHYWSEHGMGVKGTTLQGIDEARSKQKKLRKPADTLPLITGSTAKAAERAFENLKTKEASTNGRINEFTVILRAVK